MIWTRYASVDAVARAACARIVRAAADAIVKRGRFSIVLAGGTTPEACYRLLSASASDWGRWHVYFGDERCLAASDPMRNSRMAADALLDSVPIPARQIHPIPAELGAAAAARSYALTIAHAMPFDMVLLGVGEDGHTASLFPGQFHSEQQLVVAVHAAPKPPAERVSLSLSSLSNSRQALILVTGKNKQKAVARWHQGDPLPVAGIRSQGCLEVLIDRSAESDARFTRNHQFQPESNNRIINNLTESDEGAFNSCHRSKGEVK